MEDPLVPEELEPLDEPEDVEPLDDPDDVEPLDDPVDVEPLDGWDDEEEDPAGANLTASAQVDAELDRDSITTRACPEKSKVPSKTHWPAFCC